MELTITNIVLIMAGLISLAITLIIYVYFNGGLLSIINLLMGIGS